MAVQMDQYGNGNNKKTLKTYPRSFSIIVNNNCLVFPALTNAKEVADVEAILSHNNKVIKVTCRHLDHANLEVCCLEHFSSHKVVYFRVARCLFHYV